MKRIHHKVRGSVFQVLDVFYPIFKKFMPLQTYHYLACGESNTLLGLLLFTLSHNFLFKNKVVDLGFIVFEPYIAALGVSLIVTLPIGFYLSMYVIFQGSYLRRRTQFLRYFSVIMGCMVINYVCLKF